MILKFAVELLCGLVSTLLGSMQAISMPVNGIQVLATFTSYGAFVVGSDLLLTFCSVVVMWMSIKLSLGIILFIWRLIPFT